jgi:hypothetical protein
VNCPFKRDLTFPLQNILFVQSHFFHYFFSFHFHVGTVYHIFEQYIFFRLVIFLFVFSLYLPFLLLFFFKHCCATLLFYAALAPQHWFEMHAFAELGNLYRYNALHTFSMNKGQIEINA